MHSLFTKSMLLHSTTFWQCFWTEHSWFLSWNFVELYHRKRILIWKVSFQKILSKLWNLVIFSISWFNNLNRYHILMPFLWSRLLLLVNYSIICIFVWFYKLQFTSKSPGWNFVTFFIFFCPLLAFSILFYPLGVLSIFLSFPVSSDCFPLHGTTFLLVFRSTFFVFDFFCYYF